MKIHYFQRYHSKENVHTSNAMLLLSRLYEYSHSKFYMFIQNILPDNTSPEIIFKLQEKNRRSVPDAVIMQPSFKIVIETKLQGQFNLSQLTHHLESFKKEETQYQILLTLDPNPIDNNIKKTLDDILIGYWYSGNKYTAHKHYTFENLIKDIREVIDERDIEMIDIVNDYEEYCYASNLITNNDKQMKVRLSNETFELNKSLNLYYDKAAHGTSKFGYLGLYKEKSVKLIGKITHVVTAIMDKDKLIVKGAATEDMKKRIFEAIEHARKLNWDLFSVEHRYWFVEKFYDTDFRKETPYPLMGSKIFNLCDTLQIDTLPSTEEIANQLKEKYW